jgi:hypothetical protein
MVTHFRDVLRKRRMPSSGPAFGDELPFGEAPLMWLILAAIAPVLLWATMNAPRPGLAFGSLVGAAALLEASGPDSVRFGKRVVSPALTLSVAGFLLYGPPVAVLLGGVRGAVRALIRPAGRLQAAQIFGWAVLAPLFASLAAQRAVHHGPWALAALVFLATALGLDIVAAVLRFAAPPGGASADAWRQFFPWPPLQYASYGILGYAAAHEIAAGQVSVLFFLAAPFAVARASLGATGWGTERYVAALERENDALLNRMGQFDRANGDLIEALAAAIDEHDGAPRGRTQRIAQISCTIGAALGISGWRLEILRRASLLHDVGILALPPGERGPAHCDFGARLVARWRDGRIIGYVIQQHHERCDGTGYPRGLRRDQIALEARIVAVAEAFVNLTTGPQAVSTMEALEDIRRRQGTDFDPHVVEMLPQAAEPRTADVLPMVRRVR